MPMDFIYQNILLIALVVVSGVALILPMLMRSGANDVNPAAKSGRTGIPCLPVP